MSPKEKGPHCELHSDAVVEEPRVRFIFNLNSDPSKVSRNSHDTRSDFALIGANYAVQLFLIGLASSLGESLSELGSLAPKPSEDRCPGSPPDTARNKIPVPQREDHATVFNGDACAVNGLSVVHLAQIARAFLNLSKLLCSLETCSVKKRI
jgi:hypothetical protein